MLKQRVIRGTMSMTGSTFLNMVFGFIGVTIAARVVPEEDFGVYFLALTVVYLLEVIGNFGLRLSAARFIAGAEGEVEREDLVNNLLSFRIISVFLVCLLGFFGKPLLLQLFPSTLLSSLYIYVLVLFSVQLTESTLTFIMQGFHLYGRLAVIQILISISNLTLVCLFLLAFDLGILGLILASISSLSVGIVLRYRAIPSRKRFALNRSLLKKIFRFGLPLQGNDVFTFIIQRVHILILASLMGPVYIAYLEVAAKIPSNFRRLSHAVHSVYFPSMAEYLAKKRVRDAEDILNNFLRIGAFFMMYCTLFLAIFQKEIIVLLFSDKYLVAAPALGLLMVVTSISIVSQILDNAFVASGRSSYLLVVNSTVAVVSTVANVALIPIFGFMGAVYARLAAEIVGNPLSAWFVRREGIAVRLGEYIKPAILMVLCWGAHTLWGGDSILLRATILLAFLVLSFALSIITLSDVSLLIESLRPARKVAVEQ